MKKITIILMCLCFLSCKKKTSKEELLAGKEYKYWLQLRDSVNAPAIKRISYFDRDNRSIGYEYNEIQKEFYLPEFDDLFYYPYWQFINDTIIDIGTGFFIIKTLTEMDLIMDFRGTELRYKVAPMEIIPKEFQKKQEVPKELR